MESRLLVIFGDNLLNGLENILNELDQYNNSKQRYEHQFFDETFHYQETRRINLSQELPYKPRETVIARTFPMKKSMTNRLREAGFKFLEETCVICLETSDYKGFPKTKCCEVNICIECFTKMLYNNNITCPHCRHDPIYVVS